MKSLKALFLAEFTDIFDAEKRIAKALPRHAKAPTRQDRQVIGQSQVEETKTRAAELKEIFAYFDVRAEAEGTTLESTDALAKEVDDIAQVFNGSDAFNATRIAALPTLEDYEMADYDCLHEGAALIGNGNAGSLRIVSMNENGDRSDNDSLNGLENQKNNAEALSEL